ncbi:MAG: hypothetical protein ISS55_05235, partial [Dehalococcoidales bacterium]|nr:hypothetical protein [Dehalococcoidales bacterium]
MSMLAESRCSAKNGFWKSRYNLVMYLKRCGQTRLKRDGVYWQLVESY